MSGTRHEGARTIRWLLGAIGRRGKGFIALLCALQVLNACLGVGLAPVMQHAVDAACAQQATQFSYMLAAFAGILLAQIVLGACTRWLRELGRSTLDNRLRARVFSGVLDLPARQAGKSHSAALVSRMTSDVTVVTDGLMELPATLASCSIRLVGALAVMFLIAPLLALVFLVAGCVVVAVSVGLRGILKRRHRDMQEAESNMRVFLQECLESLLVVHAFGAEEKMQRANERNMQRHKRARMRKNTISNIGNTGFVAVMQTGYVLGFAWCAFGILHGTMSYGMLTAVIQLVGQLQSPIANLGGLFSRYSSLAASGERLLEVVTHEDAGAGRGARDGAASVRGFELEAISYEHVSFRYEAAKPVLEDFSLRIEAGSFVAIAGPSGVGKSTAMKLLLDVYEPDSGHVRLLGHAPGARAGSCSIAPAQAPAGTFAYVPQGNHLMSGSIREAVAFSEPDENAIDDERVAWACRMACADSFVEQLPDGYRTCLGERGSGLSEGQTQRLAVARALYSGAPVLLLDEATSALDAATERRMLENIRELAGCTVVVVTHRSEAMQLCDTVLRIGADGSMSQTRS